MVCDSSKLKTYSSKEFTLISGEGIGAFSNVQKYTFRSSTVAIKEFHLTGIKEEHVKKRKM